MSTLEWGNQFPGCPKHGTSHSVNSKFSILAKQLHNSLQGHANTNFWSGDAQAELWRLGRRPGSAVWRVRLGSYLWDSSGSKWNVNPGRGWGQHLARRGCAKVWALQDAVEGHLIISAVSMQPCMNKISYEHIHSTCRDRSDLSDILRNHQAMYSKGFLLVFQGT